METNVEEQPTIIDTAKLVGAGLVLLTGLVGYYYFPDASVFLRALGVLVAMGAAAAIVFTSLQGRWLWKFMQGARTELNKVIWPTKEEATQTTIVVLVVALAGGIFFWLLDLLLLWLTTRVTGQGGF